MELCRAAFSYWPLCCLVSRPNCSIFGLSTFETYVMYSDYWEPELGRQRTYGHQIRNGPRLSGLWSSLKNLASNASRLFWTTWHLAAHKKKLCLCTQRLVIHNISQYVIDGSTCKNHLEDIGAIANQSHQSSASFLTICKMILLWQRDKNKNIVRMTTLRITRKPSYLIFAGFVQNLTKMMTKGSTVLMKRYSCITNDMEHDEMTLLYMTRLLFISISMTAAVQL